MSTRIERNESIATLEAAFDGATGVYLTDFNGIDVDKITKFRTELRNVDAKYLVVKNTLAKIALEKKGFGALNEHVKGPIGIAVTTSDSVAPAKVIKAFRKENKDLMDLKIASLDGTVFSSMEVEAIADLPSREILLSQLLSVLNAPMSNLVGSLSGVFTKLTGTLEAVKAAKEG